MVINMFSKDISLNCHSAIAVLLKTFLNSLRNKILFLTKGRASNVSRQRDPLTQNPGAISI